MPGSKDLVPRKVWERSPRGLWQPWFTVTSSEAQPLAVLIRWAVVPGYFIGLREIFLLFFIISRVLRVPTLSRTLPKERETMGASEYHAPCSHPTDVPALQGLKPPLPGSILDWLQGQTLSPKRQRPKNSHTGAPDTGE